MILYDRYKLGTPEIRILLSCLFASSLFDVYYGPGHCRAASMESGGAPKVLTIHIYLHISDIRYIRELQAKDGETEGDETAFVSVRGPTR